MKHARLALSAALALGWLCTAAAADEPKDWTFNLIEENDSLVGGDKHYTQGLLASLTAGHRPGDPWYGRWNGIADAIFLPGTENGSRVYFGGFFGQSIFTPGDIRRANPDPSDRPYAGWLYGGVSLYRETDTTLDRGTLTLGLVGPGAGARKVQNGWHRITNPWIGAAQAEGWSSQLENEPGIVLSEERKWRFSTAPGGIEADILPEVNVSLGNIFTYAGAGAMFRVGQRLRADWGQPRIQPAISGSDFVNPDGFAGHSLAWYFFAGGEGRAVARNIFLDGNTWDDGPSVDKKPLVADLTAGAAIVHQRFRLAASYTYRTHEFDGQQGHDDFLALNLSIQF